MESLSIKDPQKLSIKVTQMRDMGIRVLAK